jgi:NAD-dependent dihydropyrimidine dehydrogenase PreA subunit
LAADHVLISVGQGILWGGLLDNCNVVVRPNNTMAVDGFTYQSDHPDIFGGGDSVTGPKFAIDAIAQGKQAAISIHRFVQPGQSLTIGRSRREYHALDKNNLDLAGYDLAKRQVAHEGHGENHNANHGTNKSHAFHDPRGIFTEEQVKKETERCLSCGATVVDEFLCVGCGVCTTKCKFDAISLVRVYDGQGAALPDMKPIVIRHALKRKGKIAIKKMKKKLGLLS